MKKYFITAAIVIALGVGLWGGYSIATPPTEQRVTTADTILMRLKDQGFLVTKTYIFDEPVILETGVDGFLKNLFFGQTVEAHGTMEVNAGVDLTKISAENISVTSDAVTVILPRGEIVKTSLVGPLDVHNDQGLLKRMFDYDDGYNQALEALAIEAEDAARELGIVRDADVQAKREVTRLLSFVVTDRDLVVTTSSEATTE